MTKDMINDIEAHFRFFETGLARQKFLSAKATTSGQHEAKTLIKITFYYKNI